MSIQQRVLYPLGFLHQTTTSAATGMLAVALYHIWILHQTTTRLLADQRNYCCIIFGFYIKPQPAAP